MKDIFPRHGFYWILLNKQSKVPYFRGKRILNYWIFFEACLNSSNFFSNISD